MLSPRPWERSCPERVRWGASIATAAHRDAVARNPAGKLPTEELGGGGHRFEAMARRSA